MDKNNTLRGFTLIETLLYLALIVIFLGALLPVVLQIADTGAKNNTTQEVDAVARYASERMLYEIRNASSVNIASSSFGINLAASSGAMLSLANFSSTLNPTVFNVASGTLMITRGTSTSIGLTSSNTIVSSLIFSNHSTSTFQNIELTLVVADNSSSTRTEFAVSTTVNTAAEVRSK